MAVEMVEARPLGLLLLGRCPDVEGGVAVADAGRVGHPAADAVERVEPVGAVVGREEVLHQVVLALVDEDAVRLEVPHGEIEHVQAVHLEALNPVVGRLAVGPRVLAVEDDLLRRLALALDRQAVMAVALDQDALLVGARGDRDGIPLARGVDGVLNGPELATVLAHDQGIVGCRRCRRQRPRRRERSDRDYAEPCRHAAKPHPSTLPLCRVPANGRKLYICTTLSR